jgi:tellurite resistance-related uncharacterized protein
MARPYSASPVFDATTLPEALRREHRTKEGVWGLLRMLAGEVRLVFTETNREVLVTVDSPAPIPPEAPHYVRVAAPMRMQVEFYRADPLAPAADTDG